MSRSRRRTPVFGLANSKGEKEYKRRKAKAERGLLRTLLAHGRYALAQFKQVHSNSRGNMWDANCDGKRYWTQDRFDHYEDRKGVSKDKMMRK